MLTEAKRKRLQRLIVSSARANNCVHKAEQALNKFCDKEWGFAPSDRDCDGIIDGCMGGCGYSYGMDVDDLIFEMQEKAG